MMSTREERAIELFRTGGYGYNCSQSVLGAFCEDNGLDLETALKLASVFGGGATRYKGMCGAVSGAIMAIGLKCGHYIKGDIETKKFCHAKAQEFSDKFKAKNGSTICCELLGIDKDIEIGSKDFSALRPMFDSICPELVKNAVQILENMDFERDRIPV